MTLLVNEMLPFMHTDMNGSLFQPNSLAGPSSDMYMMQRQNILNMSMPMMEQQNQSYNQQRVSSTPPATSATNKGSRRKVQDDTTEDSNSQTSDQSHPNTNNKSRKKNTPKDTDDDERRKNFLERNRQGNCQLPTIAMISSTCRHRLTYLCFFTSCTQVSPAQEAMAKQPASQGGILDQ